MVRKITASEQFLFSFTYWY